MNGGCVGSVVPARRVSEDRTGACGVIEGVVHVQEYDEMEVDYAAWGGRGRGKDKDGHEVFGGVVSGWKK